MIHKSRTWHLLATRCPRSRLCGAEAGCHRSQHRVAAGGSGASAVRSTSGWLFKQILKGSHHET